MTELKTLKDIFNNFPRDKMDWNGKIYRIDMADELRNEAIKWRKSEIAGLEGTNVWIEHFFNITEEDLK